MKVDRRSLLGAGGAALAAAAATPVRAAPGSDTGVLSISDDGWRLWIDQAAPWRDDELHLPGRFALADLPVRPPTGGWAALDGAEALSVQLPTTVEEHLWGLFGTRPYTGEEYRYAETDDVPRYGAYRGVSWWTKDIDVPTAARGQRAMLNIRGARLRAEVFVNQRLVGYSVMGELPFSCDVTAALRPGERNRLAIRITNPGGRYDWRDSTTMMWGKAKLFASHGFGGLDRGLTLSFHPMAARIEDAWVLNTPEPRRATAVMQVRLAEPGARTLARSGKARVGLDLVDDAGAPVAADIRLQTLTAIDDHLLEARLDVRAPRADLWDIETPRLYRLRFGWAQTKGVRDVREVRFGFRWFAPEGLGADALLRLNGRRVKLYSAISWGYWGFNGLWPTPQLAEREVDAAKTLGLNALHFHRNVGKAEVFRAMDEKGLLRVMEPGGGRHAIARDLKPGEQLSAADVFSRDFLVEKCKAMVRAFRSHPSLAHYTLQNELGANLENPDVQAVLKAMHDLDPSRAVVLNDGFVQRGAAQAMYLPYSDRYWRSDEDQWGGWWNNHQGAGDQWYDRFYRGKDDYIHRQTGRPFIVEFGEMEGCAVADNHPRMVAEILAHGGKSYDLQDHLDVVTATNAYLDRWGFRKAFPTSEALFLSIGAKAYDSWRNYLENIRIGDAVDIACISGWESTVIENHSGVVDNLRGFKADPARLSQSLRPVMAIAKPRALAYGLGQAADLDVYLFNDTGRPVSGELVISVLGPDGRSQPVSRHALPAQAPDTFSYLLAEHVRTPPFAVEGPHIVRVALRTGGGEVISDREIWATGSVPTSGRRLRIGVSGVARSLQDQLATLPGAVFEPFVAGRRYDGLIASGLKADEIQRRQVGEQTGLEAQPSNAEKPPLVLGELPAEVLAAVRGGTPLLALVQEDGLADGVARQLSELGLFRYAGQVGGLRAPWMGNWNYMRAHPTFAGLPTDMAAGVLHQIEGQPSNGLLVDGEGVEVIAAYSRDHDRRDGAASFTARAGSMRVLVHRLPDMAAPLQRRWLANAVQWLSTREVA